MNFNLNSSMCSENMAMCTMCMAMRCPVGGEAV